MNKSSNKFEFNLIVIIDWREKFYASVFAPTEFFMFSTKSSNKYSESCGPGAASGWYCTEKAALSFTLIPSMLLSFKFTCVISTISDFLRLLA